MSLSLNLIGVIATLTAQAIFFLSILIFAARIAQRERLAYWLGIPQMLTGLVLIYLLIEGPNYGPPGLFYLSIGLMLFWLLLKLVLVYILRLDFGNTRWVIIYMLLFFIGTAGMVVVSSLAGIFWLIFAAIIYFIMVGFAFFQRIRTSRKKQV